MSLALATNIGLIPSLGMIAGLSASFTVPLCFALLLWHLRKANFTNLKSIKTALLFAVWCLCSCFWSITPASAIKIFLLIFVLIFICLILLPNISYLAINNVSNDLCFNSLSIGIGIAVILFFIEYHTNGLLTDNFKALFEPNSVNRFHLYNLDRGCAILSLASWLIIYIAISRHRYILASSYYALIFYILSISESLASFVGFILASIAFLLIKLKPQFFVNFIKHSLIIGSLAMPIIAYKMEPRIIADNYSLPLSAKHRLFIWHYASEKIWQKPVLGHGFGSSRHLTITADEYIDYNGERWSPLPLHPHNNIIQILLETGLVGFLLFLGLVYQFFDKIGNELAGNAASVTHAAAFASCFVNYYIIGMISFSMWQLWWVYVGAWLVLMFKWQNKILIDKIKVNHVKNQ